MKIKIITLANHRPDFIELQFNSIKKFVKDRDVEYVIFNTSEDKTRSDEINNICNKLGIQTIKVKKTKLIKFIDYNISRTVARTLNWVSKNYIKNQKDM